MKNPSQTSLQMDENENSRIGEDNAIILKLMGQRNAINLSWISYFQPPIITLVVLLIFHQKIPNKVYLFEF